ncbi:MAG: hypothetical protein WA160_01655 [Pseudobdellovibrio sp.]
MEKQKELNNFSGKDFHYRWFKARLSALQKVKQNNSFQEPSEANDYFQLEANLIDQYFSNNLNISADEKVKRKDELLRGIFDNSRILAMSLSKHLGLSYEVEDFQNLLGQSTVPCFQGQWESRESARILSRKGCDACTSSGKDACDYWREALDGLVMGLGDKERLARHASVRHGDAACVDVFYSDADGRKETLLAWGPLPEHMTASLKLICDEFEAKMKTSIILKGLSEGVLYFEFKSATDMLCSGGQLLTSAFLRKIQKKYPGILVHEITPRAVIGAGV